MKLKSRLAIGLLGAALAFSAQAGDVTDPKLPRSLPAEGPVSVSWADPAEFSDLKFSGNRWEAVQGDWVRQLAEYARTSATKRLAPGEKLEIDIVDITRAGRYEPWLGPQYDHVRMVRDRYPPRMTLSYTLYGADGQVLAQNQRKLADMGFLMGASPVNDSDPLRYEKRMIDDWVRRDIGPQRVVDNR